jgi:hypothetical protein
MVRRWTGELRARTGHRDAPIDQLLEEFADLLVSLLAPGVGPLRDLVEPIFQQTAELYGSLGAVRGLAAGEAVEEMQLLREAILRFLYRDPAFRGGAALGFREVLRLNRLVDLAVTYASVGHTDALFFSLLHGTGVTARPSEEALEEIRSQLRHLAEERDRLLTPGTAPLTAAPE